MANRRWWWQRSFAFTIIITASDTEAHYRDGRVRGSAIRPPFPSVASSFLPARAPFFEEILVIKHPRARARGYNHVCQYLA